MRYQYAGYTLSTHPSPQFPKLAAAPGQKCLHRANGRPATLIQLYCVKPFTHKGNHLHDVVEGVSYKVVGDDVPLARSARSDTARTTVSAALDREEAQR
jgi:hypothetical protein